MQQPSWRTRLGALFAVPLMAMAVAGCGAEGDSGEGSVQGVTDDEILIAAFGPLTGPSSWIGLGTRDGLLMAVDEINAAGGIHGRKLRVEYFDDRYQVAQAQAVIRRIQSEVRPFMIYSGTGSTVFVSVADMLRQTGLPVYNGFSGSEIVRKEPEAPNMFHGQAVSARYVREDLVALLKDLGVERVAVMHDVGEWGRSVCEPSIEAMEEQLGLKPLTVQTYAAGDTDFSGQLVAIRNVNPQVIVNCGHYPEAAVIVAQARQLNVKALIIGDTAQGNDTVWKRAGDAAENFIFNWYSPYFLTDDEGPMNDFRKRYMEKYPDAPEGRPAHSDTFAYGDGLIIAEALKRAGRDLTPEKFIEAMKSIENFQASPITAVANFSNPGNDGFRESVWMRVKDGNAVRVDETNMSELKALIAGL